MTETQAKFMVHFQGAVYANELYCVARGDNVFTLERAIEECEEQFGPDGWETYNGHEGENRFVSDADLALRAAEAEEIMHGHLVGHYHPSHIAKYGSPS
jgi:hypothetical protein